MFGGPLHHLHAPFGKESEYAKLTKIVVSFLPLPRGLLALFRWVLDSESHRYAFVWHDQGGVVYFVDVVRSGKGKYFLPYTRMNLGLESGRTDLEGMAEPNSRDQIFRREGDKETSIFKSCEEIRKKSFSKADFSNNPLTDNRRLYIF